MTRAVILSSGMLKNLRGRCSEKSKRRAIELESISNLTNAIPRNWTLAIGNSKETDVKKEVLKSYGYFLRDIPTNYPIDMNQIQEIIN